MDLFVCCLRHLSVQKLDIVNHVNINLTKIKIPNKRKLKRQQGKPYTATQRSKIIQSIKPYLMLGYDLKNACVKAQQPYTTVLNWVNGDIALCAEVVAWQGMINAKARQNIVQEINDGNIQESKWWLERREKIDFSLRQELTGEEGKDLTGFFSVDQALAILSNNDNADNNRKSTSDNKPSAK